MAAKPTFVKVFFRDAAGTVREVVYRLRDSIDPVDPDSLDLIADAAAALETALNVLTWDHIDKYQVYWDDGGGGAAANVAANNQITAFSRAVDATTNDNTSFEVPAFDDAVYARDENNFLNAAYDLAAATVAGLIANPETGNDINYSWSQSRTRKLRGKRIS